MWSVTKLHISSCRVNFINYGISLLDAAVCAFITGYKNSGIGRDKGEEALGHFTQVIQFLKKIPKKYNVLLLRTSFVCETVFAAEPMNC